MYFKFPLINFFIVVNVLIYRIRFESIGFFLNERSMSDNTLVTLREHLVRRNVNYITS